MTTMILVTWLICAVLCAVVAESKGRSAMGWLLVGLFTGIFGLLAVVGMPVLVNDPNRPRTPHGPQRSDFAALTVIFVVAAAAVAATLLLS